MEEKAQEVRKVQGQGKFLHCVHTACILRTQRLGYSHKYHGWW